MTLTIEAVSITIEYDGRQGVTSPLAFSIQICNHSHIPNNSLQMQLTNSAVIVDFFPEAFIAEADDQKGMIVTIKRFNKRVTFRATNQKSYSTVTMLNAKHEWAERIARGAEVTDYHTDKMPRSEYAPMACCG